MRSAFIRSVFGFITVVGLSTVAATSVFAAKPIATLSSVGPVVISGTEMSAVSAMFWPVANLDEISTLGSRAVLILPDRSRITLSSHTKAKIETDGARTRVTVLSGSGHYDLASPTSATILVGSRVVSASATQGKFAEAGDGKGSRMNNASEDSDDDKEDKHKKHKHPSPDR
jgi:ferric-dicitrate binding protein FerR (iron transport regulator)